MKKLFLIVALFIIPFYLFADETATSSVTVNVRYQDTLVFSGPIIITKNSKANIPDNTSANREIASDSAMVAVKTADNSSADFAISDLVYYADFGSLYVNCVDIVSPPKHACANWQYVVNGIYPPIGMDKYILSGGDIIYFYFGNPRRILLSSPSAQTTTPTRVKAENYDYVNNAWTVLSGATIGATQTNPNDPYSPLVISSVASDENGFADFILGTAGTYNIGLAMDYYFPAETLSVLEPVPEGSSSEANNQARNQIQVIETGMAPSQSIVNEPDAESGQPQETPEPTRSMPSARRSSAGAAGRTGEFGVAADEAKETREVIVKMDISVNDFIERYNIALQNQKFAAKEESKNKSGNEPLMVYNDKNGSESQTAGAIIALKPREIWLKKIFSKISGFLKFKNKNK